MKARLVIINGCHAALWATLVVCMCAGCGKSGRATITGTVQRHDGTPLAGANVIARSNETGNSANSSTDQTGYFELGTAEQGDGVPPGTYAVVIVEDRGDADHRAKPTIATKYRNPAKSGISLDLKAGESKELNLKLDAP